MRFSLDKITIPPLKLFGIAIHIDKSWFFIVGFVAWTLASGYFPTNYPWLTSSTCWLMGISSAVLLFICVLLHELGHSLVAKAHGIPVPRITLFIFGGMAQIESDPKQPFIEFKIAIAGPLVSALIAGICYRLFMVIPIEARSQFIAVAILKYLTIINIMLIVFNMLPGFPLDGGRVLRSIIWARTGSVLRATQITSSMGVGLGVGLWVLGAWWIIKGAVWVGIWYIFIGFFLRNAARASLSQVEYLEKRSKS